MTACQPAEAENDAATRARPTSRGTSKPRPIAAAFPWTSAVARVVSLALAAARRPTAGRRNLRREAVRDVPAAIQIQGGGSRAAAKVTHLVTVETKSRASRETAQTRSVSTKAWNITSRGPAGKHHVRLLVEAASMWQQLSGRQEIRYDSSKDESPPPEYKHVAESVGKPLATVTISPTGRIVDRKDAKPQFNPGIGELTIPLPEEAVPIGQQWATDGELLVRLPDMQVKRIKTRQLYTLDKVETGIATIAVQTQILTPVNDPRVQSQLVQRIKRGEVKFDLDAGRVHSPAVGHRRDRDRLQRGRQHHEVPVAAQRRIRGRHERGRAESQSRELTLGVRRFIAALVLGLLRHRPLSSWSGRMQVRFLPAFPTSRARSTSAFSTALRSQTSGHSTA